MDLFNPEKKETELQPSEQHLSLDLFSNFVFQIVVTFQNTQTKVQCTKQDIILTYICYIWKSLFFK